MVKYLIAICFFMTIARDAAAQAANVDFESDGLGEVNPQNWSQSYMLRTDQMNLFTVAEGVGFKGSRGLRLDTKAAASSYRLLNTTPLAGNEFTVSARFQIEVDTDKAAKPNHPLIAVYFNTSDKWYTGQRLDLMLLRRSNPEHPTGYYGLTSIINKGVPVAWIEPQTIGLPQTLSKTSNGAALSEWFSLYLTIKRTEAKLWDVSCYVLDEEGNSIEAFGAKDIDLPREFNTAKALYAGITTGWSDSNKYKILSEAGVKGVHVDDFYASGSE